MVNLSIIPAPAWLALAAAGWYLASRTLSGPAARAGDRWTTLAVSLPFACTCFAAILLRQPEIAIGVTLAGSVAATTLVLGLIGLTQPVRPSLATEKHWLFLLPTAFVALLIGFSGEIRLAHAGVLLLQGVAVVIGSAEPSAARGPTILPFSLSRWTVRFTACLAMLTASLLAVHAAASISRDLQQSGSGLVAAVMLAPALALPMIGLSTRLAGEHQPVQATSLIVNVVLINVCLLLPLSAIAWIAQPRGLSAVNRLIGGSAATQPTSQPTTNAAEEVIRFAYPISVWRIDTTLLLAAGIFLFLLAFRRIQLARVEATALILVYVVYLMLTAVAAR